MVEVVKLSGEEIITTTIRYVGQNKFYISKDFIKSFLLDIGDEMLIEIKGFNKFNNGIREEI